MFYQKPKARKFPNPSYDINGQQRTNESAVDDFQVYNRKHKGMHKKFGDYNMSKGYFVQVGEIQSSQNNRFEGDNKR